MSAQKTERLLNLVICLLSTRQFLAKDQIRTAVPQYAECAHRRGLRPDVRAGQGRAARHGHPPRDGRQRRLVRGRGRLPGRPGRLRRARDPVRARRAGRPRPGLAGLAAGQPGRPGLAGAAQAQGRRHRAGRRPAWSASSRGSAPASRRSSRSTPRSATAARSPSPTATSGLRRARTRHLEPWGIVSRHGRWYVVGHDRDRDATRVFRLSRVVGAVEPIGAPGEVTVPEGVDFRGAGGALVLAAADPREARLRARPGPASGAAAAGDRADPTPARTAGTSWSVPFGDADVLAEEVTGFGPDVVVGGAGGGARRRRPSAPRRARARPAVARGQPAMSAGATERLSRLLAMVPYLAQRQGIPLAAAARRVRHHRGAAGQGPRAALRVRHARATCPTT